MNWKDIPDNIRNKLLKAKRNGIPVEDLASPIGMKATTLDRRLREWANVVEPKGTRIKVPKKAPQKYTDFPVFSGNAVITGDYHMPYVDYQFANVMLETSAKILGGKKRLIIAGDLFNMDVFSVFPPLNSLRPSFRTELNSAISLLRDMRQEFDVIDILLGNHERRIIYQVLGEISSAEIEKLVNTDGVRFHDYGYCVLETELGDWRVTHQRNYSRSAQTVGVKLAHKFRQHIITHHQHKVSKGYDTSGENVVIDNGCMADPEKLDYVNLVDSTSPVMKQSFVVVRDGTGLLFANDRQFTDYGFL